MTSDPADPDGQPQHPWSKYYAERGLARPGLVRLAAPEPPKARVGAPPPALATKPPAMSPELKAAVEAVPAQARGPSVTAAPFITAMQREAVARALEHRRRMRLGRMAAVVVAVLLALHVILSTTVFRQPFASSVHAHVRMLPARLVPLYNSVRQPLRGEGVVISQADRIDDSTMRYVATVTLRLRKPLYIVAESNGTLTYRRLQQAVVSAREQELRYNLFTPLPAPPCPEMPLLLQRTHQAGETIVVRVPFIARRFGWKWRLGAPLLELRMANRTLVGDSIEQYANIPVLLFGDPATLPEIRRRIKLAQDYIRAVADAIQRRGITRPTG